MAGWQRNMQTKLCYSAFTNSMNVSLCASRKRQFKCQARNINLSLSDWLAPYRMHSRWFSLGVEGDTAAREDSEGKRGPRNLILAVDRSKVCTTPFGFCQSCSYSEHRNISMPVCSYLLCA